MFKLIFIKIIILIKTEVSNYSIGGSKNILACTFINVNYKWLTILPHFEAKWSNLPIIPSPIYPIPELKTLTLVMPQGPNFVITCSIDLKLDGKGMCPQTFPTRCNFRDLFQKMSLVHYPSTRLMPLGHKVSVYGIIQSGLFNPFCSRILKS